jgi:O-methyltransferase
VTDNRLLSNFDTAVHVFLKRVVQSAPLPPMILLEKICCGLRFKEWRKRARVQAVPYFQERFELYAHLNKSVLKESPIDYLEFGVAEGGSIREWMRLNIHPGSRFFGFDTFEGLPEVWRHVGCTTAKGTFGTHGQPPLIANEPRVAWLVGLFQDTVPGFLASFHPRSNVVVHMDADVYSSTLYVLAALNAILGAGTIVLFDEFASFDNEFRALEDFSSAFRKDYSLLACGGQYYDQVAIQFQR